MKIQRTIRMAHKSDRITERIAAIKVSPLVREKEQWYNREPIRRISRKTTQALASPTIRFRVNHTCEGDNNCFTSAIVFVQFTHVQPHVTAIAPD